MPHDAGPTFLVLGHEDVEGGLRASLQLAPLILLSLAILRTFQLDHPHDHSSPMMTSMPLVDLA
jgi:hypothetical protein